MLMVSDFYTINAMERGSRPGARTHKKKQCVFPYEPGTGRMVRLKAQGMKVDVVTDDNTLSSLGNESPWTE
jgi:hypothetical protein